MRAARLLTILNMLQLRGRVTAAELAERLEVSKRTVYRDIDELSAAGVPVYADRGPSGGFELLDGFRSDLTALTSEEREALLLAGIPSAAADLGLSRAAAAAKLKLVAALSNNGLGDAGRLSERFHLDPLDWYRRAPPPPHLRTVAEALWQDRLLEIVYASWKRRARSTVQPLGIVLKAGRWYLLARAGARDRIYRLDKFEEAKLLEQHFERSRDFDLATAWSESVGQFEAELRRGAARIRVAPGVLDRLDQLYSDMAEPILAAAPDPEGWREATVPIESVAHAAGLLLAFADDVEVLEPHALREELLARARRVQRLYEG